MVPDIDKCCQIWKLEQNRLTPKYNILNSFVPLMKCSVLLVQIILRSHSKLPVIIIMYMLNVLPHADNYFILPSSVLELPVLVYNLNIFIPTIYSSIIHPVQKWNTTIKVSKTKCWSQIPKASIYLRQTIWGSIYIFNQTHGYPSVLIIGWWYYKP